MLPPKHRCPWFLTGLALGLLLSAWAINKGMSPPPSPTATAPHA